MLNRLDNTVARMLFVSPPASLPETEEDQSSENLMGFSLAVSALRCTLQYVVLPFLLPIIGIAAGWALGLTMVINIAAIVAIVMSVRRMWATNYKHKWRYFAIAVPAMLVLVSFFVLDIVTWINI